MLRVEELLENKLKIKVMSYQYKKAGYQMNKIFDKLENDYPEGVSWTVLNSIYRDVSKGSNSLSYNLYNWLDQSIYRKDGRYISKGPSNIKSIKSPVYKVCHKPIHNMIDRLFSLHKKMRAYKKYLTEVNASLDKYDPLVSAMEVVALRIGQCKEEPSFKFNKDTLRQLNYYNREMTFDPNESA